MCSRISRWRLDDGQDDKSRWYLEDLLWGRNLKKFWRKEEVWRNSEEVGRNSLRSEEFLSREEILRNSEEVGRNLNSQLLVLSSHY